MSLAACTPVTSGSGFLKASLAYLDCAGKAVGSLGFAGLTQPGSIIGQLMLTAITLFIAWHGIRMMFGRLPDMGDAVLAVAKIGLVTMLVTSWPAVRTLFAEPVFAGPVELAAETRLQGRLTLEDRLQRADDGIVALTKWGTGKLDIRAGQTADGKPAATEFSGVALTDNLALGLGRLAFLVSSLLSLGLLKLLSGVMIAALPIFAGLLLFDVSRGLFWGWLRLVFALFVASFAVPLVITVELSLLEPWLATAIEQRSAFYATPSAPTELLAISATFLLILTGSMALIARACFALNVPALGSRISASRQSPLKHEHANSTARLNHGERMSISRAESLATTLSRIDHRSGSLATQGGGFAGRSADNDGSSLGAGPGVTNSNRRRAKQRVTLSHARRDRR